MTECVKSHEIVKVSVCEDSQSPRSQLSKQDFSVNWTCSVLQSCGSLKKVQLTQKSYLDFSLFVVQDRWIYQTFIVCCVDNVY